MCIDILMKDKHWDNNEDSYMTSWFSNSSQSSQQPSTLLADIMVGSNSITPALPFTCHFQHLTDATMLLIGDVWKWSGGMDGWTATDKPLNWQGW